MEPKAENGSVVFHGRTEPPAEAEAFALSILGAASKARAQKMVDDGTIDAEPERVDA